MNIHKHTEIQERNWTEEEGRERQGSKGVRERERERERERGGKRGGGERREINESERKADRESE